MSEDILNISLVDFIEIAEDGIIVCNKSGHIIMVNKKMSSFSGYLKDELIGRHISFLFQDDELEESKFFISNPNIAHNVLIKRSMIGKHENDMSVEMKITNYGENYITIIRDIREKIKQQQLINDLRLHVKSISKAVKIGIIYYESATKHITYNEEMCQMMSKESFNSCETIEDWLDLIHEDDQRDVKNQLENVLQTKTSAEIVYRVESEAQTYKTIKSTISFINSNSPSSKLMIFSTDISQKQQKNDYFPQNENTFQMLANSTSAAVFIYQKKYLYTNPAFEKITGYSSKEALNLNFWEIIHPNYQPIIRSRGQKRIKKENVINNYEFKIISKTGEEKWINFSATSINYLGQPAAIGTAFDITNHKNTASELQASIQSLNKEKEKAKQLENNFRSYIEQNAAIMLVIDPETQNITFANYAAAKFYGYSREELTKLNITKIQTLTKEEINNKVKEVLNAKADKFHFTHKIKNGDTKEVIAYPSITISNGEKRIVMVIQDITNEVKNKDALDKSHHTYRNILNSISESIYILNKDGQFMFVNETSKRVYGYNKIDFMGKTPAFVSAPNMNNLEELGRHIERAYHGETISFEFWGLRKDGSIFPKEVVLSPGVFFGEQVVIAVARNITEQKRIHNELMEAKKKAEESDRLKSAFLANMSHEIRTPMNAILGFSDLVKDPEMEEAERMRFLNIINKSSYHLLNLINDLVDISKIHANQMKIYKSSFHLNNLLFELYEYFEGELINAGKQNKVSLILSCDLSPDKDLITSDETRLRQILHNIIGNAIKFTEKGNIEISYVKDHDKIHFSVKDEGIGISQDKLDQIFIRFQQENTTINKKFGGTGLGLAISKACTQLLGGEIWCESEKGKGTNMQFTIPTE